MTEEEFWRSTPKKIGSLWKLHRKFNGWEVKSDKTESKKVYIDEVPFL